jgi:hypothetical protein
MSHLLKTLITGILIAALFVWVTGTASGTVYKYRKDGVWHFTDNPTDVPAADLAPAANSDAAPSGDAADML